MFWGLVTGGIGGILQGVIGVAGQAITSHYEIKKKKLDIEQSSIDYAHEKEMAVLAIKSVKEQATIKLVEAQASAESAMSIAAYKHDENLGGKNVSTWVNTYRATVRPTLTYLATAVYFGFIGYMLYIGEHEFTLMTAVIALGDLVSGAWSFWFVGREAQKRLTPIVESVFTLKETSK